MRVRVQKERHGNVVIEVEYECRPLPERRFRALCLLAAAGMYGGMVATFLICAVAS